MLGRDRIVCLPLELNNSALLIGGYNIMGQGCAIGHSLPRVVARPADCCDFLLCVCVRARTRARVCMIPVCMCICMCTEIGDRRRCGGGRVEKGCDEKTRTWPSNLHRQLPCLCPTYGECRQYHESLAPWSYLVDDRRRSFWKSSPWPKTCTVAWSHQWP